MRLHARSDRRRDDGFALLELALALAVIALIAALALPWASVHGVGTLRGKAMEVAALLRADRNAALRIGRPVATLIDVPGRTIRSGTDGRTITLPDGFGLAVSENLVSGVRFFPDSRALGGEIRIASPATVGRTLVAVRIDALTASVALREERWDRGR